MRAIELCDAEFQAIVQSGRFAATRQMAPLRSRSSGRSLSQLPPASPAPPEPPSLYPRLGKERRAHLTLVARDSIRGGDRAEIRQFDRSVLDGDRSSMRAISNTGLS